MSECLWFLRHWKFTGHCLNNLHCKSKCHVTNSASLNLAGVLQVFCQIKILWKGKNLFMQYATNKNADQPAHPCSLISIFVLCSLDSIISEQGHEKMCLMSYANNKGADQPVHPCSLISAFAVRCLDSIISRFYSRNFKTLASFCGCSGRFVSGLVGNSWRHVLSCRGSSIDTLDKISSL